MQTNSNEITVNAVAKSGAPIKGIIPASFAQLTNSGIITSFTLLADGYPLGRHFALDQRHNSYEERAREILTRLAPYGLMVVEGELLYRKTGQRPNLQALFLMKGINTGLVRLLERHLPKVTDAELGYYDHTGRIIIEGALRLS